MQIGPYTLDNPLILAPMAGITDRPFRQICRELGAAMAVSEMVTSKPDLWSHPRTQLKADQRGENTPRSVQILGTNPEEMALSAQHCVSQGAQIIDINMGCPAKKVCRVAAGSALMRDEKLAGQIMASVVAAIEEPVTVKIRSGWDQANRNAVKIAKIAEESGISAITVHGRSRACSYQLEAEYETVSAVKSAVSIPVIANGDIDSPEKAQKMLQQTGVDAVMIGRAAQGKPWIFKQILTYLETGEILPTPSLEMVRGIVLQHLDALYSFYGNRQGVRIARKHIGWYLRSYLKTPDSSMRQMINQTEEAKEQLALVTALFDNHTKVLAA